MHSSVAVGACGERGGVGGKEYILRAARSRRAWLLVVLLGGWLSAVQPTCSQLRPLTSRRPPPPHTDLLRFLKLHGLHTILVPDVRAAAAGQLTSSLAASRGIKQSTNEARAEGGKGVGVGNTCGGGWVWRSGVGPPAAFRQFHCLPRQLTRLLGCPHAPPCRPQVLMVAPTAFVFNDQAAQVGRQGAGSTGRQAFAGIRLAAAQCVPISAASPALPTVSAYFLTHARPTPATNHPTTQDNTFMNSAVNSFDLPASEGGAAAMRECQDA